ncbi:MAG: putative colanic acid biosynthesis acetyltransferase [Flavobacteriaceae bacterium]|nr:putative colanic acid biosynthesis acetyltransferase [Flavobacteriaceae bacterium]
MKYTKYQNKLSVKNKIGRFFWYVIRFMFFRPLNQPFLNGFRIALLRLFGAKLGKGNKIHAKVKIWAPWNLETGDFVAIGYDAHIYNPGKIIIGNKVTISQRAHLCSATHDYTNLKNPLITKSIYINDLVWIATDTFISLGVVIGEGSIVGAGACVFKNVEPWTIVGGNPAKFIKKRVVND